MKTNISLIRGGLTIFNIAGLALLTFALLNMFGMMEESRKTIRLVDPEDFSMPTDTPRSVPNRYQNVIRDLYRTKPVPRVEPVQTQ